MPNRIASANDCKVTGTNQGLTAASEADTEVIKCPVELQDRPDLEFNAQPYGYNQTVAYAKARLDAMIEEHGTNTSGYDFAVENGAIMLNGEGKVIPDESKKPGEIYDVAIVLIRDRNGRERIQASAGVMFPEGTLEEAEYRGFKTTTAGDVIAEWHEGVPSDTWQRHFFPQLPREKQIADTVTAGLIAMREQS